MRPKSDITGAVFCGGESRRMGTHKAGLVLPGGLTMIEHIVETLSPFCREIVLVGHAKGVPDSLSHLKRIPDNYSHCGPMGGIEALLNSGLADEYLTAPCDLYQPDTKIFEMLLAYEGSCPVVVRYKNQIQPLIGRYPASLKTMATQHIAYNDLAMNHFITTCQAGFMDIPDKLGKDMINVNTPDDLKINQ
ncbi:MAG: molybdenum cofactor guanylyltransferase [Candidatus Omnitrophota bacterium]